MCVAAIAWNTHPRWRLVVAANRDEMHDRPSAPLSRWPDDRHPVLAGRDLRAGGTWLGVSENARMALVTNYRVDGFPRPELASRGALVSGWLRGQPLPDLTTMNPFNLMLIDADAARVVTNWPQPRELTLANGVHGVSNGAFETRWTKVVRLCDALAGWLDTDRGTEPLFTALADETQSPGAGPDPEHSSIFVRHPLYGTRCSTVVLIGHDGAGEIIERRFAADGSPDGETRLTFGQSGGQSD